MAACKLQRYVTACVRSVAPAAERAMVKAYFRYRHAQAFGVIATPGCNPCSSADGLEVFTGCLENVQCWRVRQGVQAYALEQRIEDDAKAPPEATRLAYCAETSTLAAGYTDGTIRLWRTATQECVTVLNGHKSAVTALAFSRGGAQLASGGKDTDVVLWDTLGETGICRLRAHTDQVTGLAFLDDHAKLVSAGKDGGLRVWDLTTQHCSQYLANESGEIWSLAVTPDQSLLAVGSADADLALYQVARAHDSAATMSATPGAGSAARPPQSTTNGTTAGSDDDDEMARDDRHDTLRSFGGLQRETSQRVAHVAFSANGAFLAACSTGKQLQFWRRRPPHEAQKKAKRRLKRLRAKHERLASADGAAAAEAQDAQPAGLCAADAWESEAVWRPESAMRGFAFLQGSAGSHACRVAAVMAGNALQVVAVPKVGNARAVQSGGAVEVQHEIAAFGNRADVRALALSDDDTTLVSTGSGGTKLWNALTGAYQNTVDTGYGLSVVCAPGARYLVVGCKSGHLDIVDVGMAAVVERVEAHTSQVWSLSALPDGSGFLSASADKCVKVWKWSRVENAGEAPQLGVELDKAVNTGQDALCARVSPDGNLVAVSLLSNVIKVFYLNTMKWFVDLYGHKLPAITMDISSDSTLLVSGSADKNIKIWGLDFGDCHKSLFAHQDSVMAVAFVKRTHYVFTAGKDRMVKFWDADKFELLLELPAHHAEVWCLAVASSGDFFVTGSHDRSLRRWQRTDEPFFIEEEKEKRLESLFEGPAAEFERRRELPEAAAAEGTVETAARKGADSAAASDRIIDALDMAAAEEEAAAADAAHAPNPLLMGLTGSQYVLRAVSDVRANDLEPTLTTLPFPDALRMLEMAGEWLSDASKVELTIRAVVILLHAHAAQFAASPACRPLLARLQRTLRGRVQALKNVMGFNLAGLQHVHSKAAARSQAPLALPVKRKALDAA